MSRFVKGKQEKRFYAFLAAVITVLLLTFAFFTFEQTKQYAVLRIYDRKSQELYKEIYVQPGDKVFFGWVHSLEKIPWHEYFHIDNNLDLILDSITFPAFGAGIPANKGKVCYVKDGLIHMEQIEQRFPELVWLNSHFATRDILVNGKYFTKGSALPEHAQMRLVIEREIHIWNKIRIKMEKSNKKL